MKFPYLKFSTSDPKRKWISRPLIPIRLIGPKENWEGLALIDSGADRSIFNIEIADELGINLEKSPIENFSGIEGSSLKARVHKIKLQILGTEYSIGFTVGFIDSPGVSAILGQEGFFDNFRIKFERDRDSIEITSAKKIK